MKLLMLNFLLVFTFGNTNADVNTLSVNSNDCIFAEAELPAGVISQEDFVLRVNTQNPSLLVDEIEVFDQSGNLVMQSAGCSAQECLVDISSLSAGTYDVTATASNGYTFSGEVTLE